jgi:hypothetical protein
LQEWTAKDGAAAQQLVAKLQDIAQQHGHALSNAEAISSTVIAEITTPAKGKQRDSSAAMHCCCLQKMAFQQLAEA